MMAYARIESSVHYATDGTPNYEHQWIGKPYQRIKVHEILLLRQELSEIFPFKVGFLRNEGNVRQWQVYARMDGLFLFSFAFWVVWERLTRRYWRAANSVLRTLWHSGFLATEEAAEVNFFADWRWDFRETLRERTERREQFTRRFARQEAWDDLMRQVDAFIEKQHQSNA